MGSDELKSRIDLVELIQSSGVQLRKTGHEWTGRCPFHDDGKASLSVNQDKRLWNCFGCGKHGDCFSWIMALRGVDFKTAVSELQRHYGQRDDGHATRSLTETIYDVVDANGETVAHHVRRDLADGTKEFIWRRDGKDSLGGLKVQDLPLYGMKALRGAAPGCDVIIVEGEKAADALIKQGCVALGTVTGANGCPSLSAFEPLIGSRRVYLWPDSDDAGRSHMDKIARQLKVLNMQPYIITWTDAAPKGDAFDYVRQGGDTRTLLEAAVAWVPTVVSNNVYTGRGGDIRSDMSDSSGTRTKLGQEIGQSSSDMAGRVREWVTHTSGWWSNDELDKDLGIVTLAQKDYRGKILRRLKDDGIVEQHQKSNRQWRYVNKRVTALDFKTASSAGVLPLKWPMGIERFVNLFSGNLVVVAGSPNAGKAALLLNFVRLNQEDFPVYYFCSEMGSVELRNRLGQFPDMAVDDWRFQAFDRAADFEDVIRPDCVNVIDYLEMTDEIYRVNTHLTSMSHKVGTGLAIVALQKKVGAALGRGAEFSLEKPRLYLSMDRGKLSIVKGKSWANPKVDPNGLSVGFKITGGCQFEITRTWECRG